MLRRRPGRLLSLVGDRRVYFVHSYRATPTAANADWVLSTTNYGDDYISSVQRGETYATQFHPEKSGSAGLDVIRGFLEPEAPEGSAAQEQQLAPVHSNGASFLTHASGFASNASMHGCLCKAHRPSSRSRCSCSRLRRYARPHGATGAGVCWISGQTLCV